MAAVHAGPPPAPSPVWLRISSKVWRNRTDQPLGQKQSACAHWPTQLPSAPASTGNKNSLAHRTVASRKQLHSLTHRTRRAKQEKVSTSNPPLTESVRGGKKLTPFILLYGRCSLVRTSGFFLCSLCHRGAPRERMGELCGRMDRHEEIHTTRYLGDNHEVEENGKINARRQR